MHIIGLALHFLAAICFAVHAVRSGQDRYWLFILFAFPIIGSLVYALAIWLPSLRQNHRARRLLRGVRNVLDPGRELREAQAEFELSATADRRLRLADALMAAGEPGQAVEHYQAVLNGVHGDDPQVRVRLAQALLDDGRPGPARDLLEVLIKERPDFRSPEGHLTYACAVAGCGDRDKARAEFEALIAYFSGFEARARYAQVLSTWGEQDSVRALSAESLRLAHRLPRYARELNRPWLEQLRRLGTS